MSKFWNVNAESLNFCGVSHAFCVEAPDNWDAERIMEHDGLILAGEEAMYDYLDDEDAEDDDAMLCNLVDLEPWDYEAYGDPKSQAWAEHFEIFE